jgi:N4-gp56 family major capsid protein
MPPNVYGDIGGRTAGFVVAELLTRGMPFLLLEKFGQSKPLPANSTQAMKFRRYLSLPLATTALSEGVTPSSKRLTSQDITMTLSQYGDVVEITDVVQDTHQDPVLKEITTILGEQAAKTIETVRYGVLRAGTSVAYANGVQRTDVNSVLSLNLQRKITRALKSQNCEPITSTIKSTPNFNTESVLPSYVALCHTDVEQDIRALPGFIDVKDYGAVTPWEAEIGSCESVRYLCSPIYASFADAGGAAGGTHLSTSGTSCDIYPILYFGRNAYAISALKGQFAIVPKIVNPETPSKSDILGQRGGAGWKSMQGAVILNDLWMCRAEVAVTYL